MTGLINFGLKSTSKVASKNNEMLSNKNLKGQHPSLCLTIEMLFKLLARSLALAYFKSFWAYSLWLINSFSSLFIFDFKLSNQRFK